MSADLELFGAGDGLTVIGYKRQDLPLVHELVRAPGGTMFQLAHDFDGCPVCAAHSVTLADFDRFMAELDKPRNPELLG